MISMIEILAINLGAVILLEIAGWLISLKRNNVTIADSLWGIGFIIIAWLSLMMGDGYILRKIIVAGAVTFWGLRLSYHITKRGKGKGEDPRYTEWRKEYGERFQFVSLFRVFLVQGLFMWLISMSQQFSQLSQQSRYLTVFDLAGIIIWITGFTIESAADHQLSKFIKDPSNRGKVMRYKLWRYSRHPNYFGESTMWWGIYIISCSVEYGVFTIISPMLITWTLLRITGVSLMEETMFKDNPEYAEYKKSTSAFIPWFPKKKPS